ncbi:MAG: hypothetical protein ACHQ52_15175, partial [Candidatus Eisenbacteria bacterium]
ACPIMFSGPMKGDFTFYRTGMDQWWSYYALLNIRWTYTITDGGGTHTANVTGQGTYQLGGDFALMQRMTLDVSTDGGPVQHFDSGMVPPSVSFPMIAADVPLVPATCLDSLFHVVAGPLGSAGVDPGATDRLLRGVLPNPSTREVALVLVPPVAGHARVDVVDVRGRVVAVLLDRDVDPGVYRVRWDGHDTRGGDAGSGVFWVRASVSGRTDRERIVRLR